MLNDQAHLRFWVEEHIVLPAVTDTAGAEGAQGSSGPQIGGGSSGASSARGQFKSRRTISFNSSRLLRASTTATLLTSPTGAGEAAAVAAAASSSGAGTAAARLRAAGGEAAAVAHVQTVRCVCWNWVEGFGLTVLCMCLSGMCAGWLRQLFWEFNPGTACYKSNAYTNHPTIVFATVLLGLDLAG